MSRRLAIIPARGGSKRISDKNIKDFCGRSMISYILKTARQSGLFDLIHVSTDNQRIVQVVEGLGFPVDFLRPNDLADDETPIMPVLRYVTERYIALGKEFDQVCLLMACAPLIEPADLKEAAKLFAKFEGTRSVLAVAQFPAPIEWSFERSANGELTPVQPGKFAIPSQDIGVKYYDAGTFAFFPARRVLKAEGAGVDTNFVGYVLQRDKAIDIDNAEDWVFAELLYLGRKQQKDTNVESGNTKE